MERILKTVNENKNNYFYIPSLGHQLYLNSLLLFDCIIGNSSSGIIEAPFLKRNVLNIGNRQKGRYKFGQVVDVQHDYKSIFNAINNIDKLPKRKQYDIKEFKKNYIAKSPSNKIINFLKNIH